ncbi:hypothetical protein O0I10_006254 [Lichtheimia ornata]|uniref:Uncharacterized protein n=1 Tax=Lichtheimia ornata TaxID=688661 RepID=A0AAD7XYV4_9FUNG|nr:uncharacterized protein O0I10_006254 [Lichtheimia ornata]KAJ8657983.1 hypothetical protein O0I10_006254 [Lichtheimia ornata]
MSPPAKMKSGRPLETFWLGSPNAKIAIDEFDPETFSQGSNSSISNLAMSPPAKMKSGRPPETFWLTTTNAEIAIDEFELNTFIQDTFVHAQHAGSMKDLM